MAAIALGIGCDFESCVFCNIYHLNTVLIKVLSQTLEREVSIWVNLLKIGRNTVLFL